MLTKGQKDLIVVPYDFTAQSDTALTHASKIAVQNEDEVKLLHIITHDTSSRLLKMGMNNEGVEDALKKISFDNEDKYHVKTTFHAEEGNLFTNIGAYLKTSNATLAVMGTHGVHGMQHIVGANSLRIVASSPTPIVIVQKRKIDSNGYKRIVLPIDGNKRGKNKIACTVAMAKYFDSKVFIFEAHRSDPYTTHRITGNVSIAIDYLSHNKIPYEISEEKSGEGSYVKQLVKHAVEVDADLVVISSHHDVDGAMDFFFGNNEVQIINNGSQIAVMCVNPIESKTDHLDVGSFNW